MVDASRICPDCRAPLSSIDDRFCDGCGYDFSSGSATDHSTWELVPAASAPAQEIIGSVISAGGPAALGAVLVTWLKHRTSDLKVKITRKDGTTLEIDGKRLSDADDLLNKAITALDDATSVEITADTATELPLPPHDR